VYNDTQEVCGSSLL